MIEIAALLSAAVGRWEDFTIILVMLLLNAVVGFPPRDDSAATIAEARRTGFEVRMVTGDHEAIAREIVGQLGLGAHIVSARRAFGGEGGGGGARRSLIEAADGFAEVFREHKFEIVRTLQRAGHIVGMTGDGVNDAPALKQADIGAVKVWLCRAFRTGTGRHLRHLERVHRRLDG